MIKSHNSGGARVRRIFVSRTQRIIVISARDGDGGETREGWCRKAAESDAILHV